MKNIPIPHCLQPFSSFIKEHTKYLTPTDKKIIAFVAGVLSAIAIVGGVFLPFTLAITLPLFGALIIAFTGAINDTQIPNNTLAAWREQQK